MKWHLLSAALLTSSILVVGCETTTPVQPVAIPRPDDPTAYRPTPQHKPMPQVGDVPGIQPGFGQPQGMPAGAGAAPGIQNEEAFIAAYAKRSPRIMIFVNRTIQGDALSRDRLDEVVHNTGESTQVSGISAADYEMIESSLVRYFDNSGRVRVMDSEGARTKLTREQVLRIENGDPQANRLLAAELQADMLIRVTAKPTTQASVGNGLRLIAKAVTTTDARNMGTAFVDMPMPVSKTNINMYTRYLSEELMGQMAQKWSLPPQYDPVEVRIYKAAAVDDSLKIRQWIQKTPGVASVQTQGATAGGNTSYSSFAVGYNGAPEDLYFLLKDGIGMSSGIKAIDLQNNTISLEVTGPMNLVTTTRHIETTTTTETRTIEDRRIEPITPAVNPGGGGGR
jgi:hypothetical protein